MHAATRSTTKLAPLIVTAGEERGTETLSRHFSLDGKTIYFRLRGPVLPPALPNFDFAAIGAIFAAMRLRRPLHIAGPVSRSLLANLEQFQAAWHAWLPDQYGVVPVTAEEEVEAPIPSERRGAFAFSGGVDSTYSILAHARNSLGRRSVPPALATLVFGFDVALGDVSGFSGAEANARAMLDELDIPLVSVETNWRRDLCHNWRMEHMAGIAAALNQFQGLASAAIVGGDEGYTKLDIPWGSNLLTNPLLGSGAMPLRTEGAELTRTERLAFILAHSSLAPKIRVCWENAQSGGNCGVCEKCISTQLNFRALGIEPQGFRQIAGLARIALIPSRSVGDNYFLIEAQKAASARRIYGWWRVAAAIGIAKNLLFRPVLLVKDKIKMLIRRNERLYGLTRRIGAARG